MTTLLFLIALNFVSSNDRSWYAVNRRFEERTRTLCHEPTENRFAQWDTCSLSRGQELLKKRYPAVWNSVPEENRGNWCICETGCHRGGCPGPFYKQIDRSYCGKDLVYSELCARVEAFKAIIEDMKKEESVHTHGWYGGVYYGIDYHKNPAIVREMEFWRNDDDKEKPSPSASNYVGCYNKNEVRSWFSAEVGNDDKNLEFDECKNKCDDLPDHYDYAAISKDRCTCGNWEHSLSIGDNPSWAEYHDLTLATKCKDINSDYFDVFYIGSEYEHVEDDKATPTPTTAPIQVTPTPTASNYVGCYNHDELRSWFRAEVGNDDKNLLYDECKKKCDDLPDHYDYAAISKDRCTCGNWIHPGSIADNPSWADEFHLTLTAKCKDINSDYFDVFYIGSEQETPAQTTAPMQDTHVGCYRSGRGSAIAFTHSVGDNLSFDECAESCDELDLDYVAIKKERCFCGDYHSYNVALHHGRKTNCREGRGGEEAFDIYYIGSEQETGGTTVIGLGKTTIL